MGQRKTEIPLSAPIEELRNLSGLSLKDISQIVGCTPSAVWQTSTHGPNIQLAKLLKIADACGFELKLYATRKST